VVSDHGGYDAAEVKPAIKAFAVQASYPEISIAAREEIDGARHGLLYAFLMVFHTDYDARNIREKGMHITRVGFALFLFHPGDIFPVVDAMVHVPPERKRPLPSGRGLLGLITV
jgi:hypothetical protein